MCNETSHKPFTLKHEGICTFWCLQYMYLPIIIAIFKVFATINKDNKPVSKWWISSFNIFLMLFSL